MDTPIVYLMKNLVNYNLWANTSLVNWLRTKPEDLLEQHVPSSFPSVKLTIDHYAQTERYWLSILKKTEPENAEAVTLQDSFNGLLKQSTAWAEYIDTVADKKIEETTLIKSPWFQSDFPNFEYIAHCMNHSTYHRGQVITIGRNLGFDDAPMTDYNFYNVNGK